MPIKIKPFIGFIYNRQELSLAQIKNSNFYNFFKIYILLHLSLNFYDDIFRFILLISYISVLKKFFKNRFNLKPQGERDRETNCVYE